MASPTPETPATNDDVPRAHGKFSVSEDWLAVVVGLGLLIAAIVGLIPPGLIP